MTPDSFPHFSLAFFYGEWVRRRNVLSIVMPYFMIFQAMFGILPSTLIIGVDAERCKLLRLLDLNMLVCRHEMAKQ